MYADKQILKSVCRRLHGIANSVLLYQVIFALYILSKHIVSLA